ncbi:MAG: hypothetical protein JW874_16315 [Spirochaetales bacterium]|nr:hypothetical protein [Spirochaetales bacterium]
MRGTRPASRLVAVTFVTALFFSCSGGDYKEVRKIYRESNSLTGQFVKNIAKADTARKAAKAIQEYNRSMTILQNKYKVYLAENPDFEGTLDSMAEPPAELAADMEQSARLRIELLNALKKILHFVEDPEVSAALKAMEKLMEKL